MPEHFLQPSNKQYQDICLTTKQRQDIFLTTTQCRSNFLTTDIFDILDFWLWVEEPGSALQAKDPGWGAQGTWAATPMQFVDNYAMPKHFFWQLTFLTFSTFDFGSRNQARLCRPKAMPKHFFTIKQCQDICLTTKQRQGIFLTTAKQCRSIVWQLTFSTFLTFDFGARNQAQEAQGTRGAGSFKEPGPAPHRSKPPIALESSKNPFRQA